MGQTLSIDYTGATAYVGSMIGVGGAHVSEMGIAMIPVHLKQSYESIMQIIGEKCMEI